MISLANLWEDSGRRPPVVVAELSGNHNGDLARALELVQAAAACGVDAIKLQTYTADTITMDVSSEDFLVLKKGSPWHGRTLHSLYDEAHTPWDWHLPIIERAKELGLAWFSSPFDFSAVDFLESLNVCCYKIASPEIVDLPLIERCAATGKPIVISTGMASIGEIGEAVEAARGAGAKKLMLLKCTTDYPAKPEDANLRAMDTLARKFGCLVGLSDHTMGATVAVAASALGAALIEKHLTLRRADGGPDAAFSLEPEEMSRLVVECREAWQARGEETLGPAANEKDYLRGRRSLYICEDMSAGDTLTPANLRSIRPGFGLAPKHYDFLLGKKVARDVQKGTPAAWDLIENL